MLYMGKLEKQSCRRTGKQQKRLFDIDIKTRLRSIKNIRH